MEKLRVTKQFMAAFSASMCSFVAGYHWGWFTPTLPKLLAEDSDVTITSDESAWVMNFLTAGYALGPIITMALVDRWGRKLLLLFTFFPYVISAILLGVANNFWIFVVARFIAGLGIGITFTALPIYIGEIAEDRIRGALCTLTSLMSNFGTLATYSIGPWVGRVPLAFFGGVLTIPFILMFLWMPDSPYYLMMKQQPDKAKKSLLFLRGTTNVEKELRDIEMNIKRDKQNTGTVRDLLVKRGNRKALIIIIGLAFAQQLTGVGPVLAYSGLIFDAAASNIDSNILVIIVGVTQVMSGLMTTFTIDFAGRRPLLMVSVSGSIVSLVAIALYFQLLTAGVDVSSFAWLPLISVMGIVGFYTIGLANLFSIILVEVVPISVKAPAFLIGILIICSVSITITKLYQMVADAYGIYFAFWGFAFFSICSGFFFYFMVPETKQKSFMEIQDDLNKDLESSTA